MSTSDTTNPDVTDLRPLIFTGTGREFTRVFFTVVDRVHGGEDRIEAVTTPERSRAEVIEAMKVLRDVKATQARGAVPALYVEDVTQTFMY